MTGTRSRLPAALLIAVVSTVGAADGCLAGQSTYAGLGTPPHPDPLPGRPLTLALSPEGRGNSVSSPLRGEDSRSKATAGEGTSNRPSVPQAQPPQQITTTRVRTAGPAIAWPTWQHVLRVVSLRDYNTRVVLGGTFLLGLAAGLVGTFMLLRKQALIGDVVSHASLPGIAVAFLVLELVRPGSGKSLPVLLTGALIAGLIGVVCTLAIRRYTRVKADAALAIVLSIFFGVGIALFTVIQNLPTGNQAGLNHFIFGKAAAMVADDVVLIAQAAFVVAVVCGALFKEFSLLCFDEEFAAAQGWPVVRLDLLLTGLVVVVTVIALQSVGLLLAVAMLIIPAASARFWTDHIGRMALASAGLGGLGAVTGVAASALFPRLAAGAVIVLAGSVFFVVSLLFGARRGVVRRMLTARRLKRKVGRDHLLRACYEYLESAGVVHDGSDYEELSRAVVPSESLQAMRHWSFHELRRALDRAIRQELVCPDDSGGYRLTRQGAAEARRVVRNHRLWELYLMRYADIASTHVDRDADDIEHFLDPEIMAELEGRLAEVHPQLAVPPSPHPISETVAAER